MTTVADIRAFLDTLAPERTAERWDNVGLLVGDPNREVQTILVALDAFDSTAQEAVEVGADLLLTHHPIIFEPLQSITPVTGTGRAILTLIRHNIAAVNAHTNLDLAADGVNFRLASVLGLNDISVIEPMGIDELGREWGLLRQGTAEDMPLEMYLEKVASTLGCSGLRYVDGGKNVHRVAVGGGSCGSELMDVYRAGCDTFVTSDCKYNTFRDALDLGINLIDAGHFQTENPICSVLRDRLAAQFPQINVILSKKHKDCIKFR